MKNRLRWTQVVVQQIILSMMTGDLFLAKAAIKAAKVVWCRDMAFISSRRGADG
jgi:hypothetical protein